MSQGAAKRSARRLFKFQGLLLNCEGALYESVKYQPVHVDIQMFVSRMVNFNRDRTGGSEATALRTP